MIAVYKQYLSIFSLLIMTHSYGAFDRVKFLICADNVHGIPGEKSASSEVSIYPNKHVVRKQVKEYLQYGVFDREVETLMKLRNFDHVPKILAADFDSNTIYMDYAGEPLTKNNFPVNWKQQVKDIIDGLRARGIQHNDIKNAELLVNNGKIMLIDFGWASEYGKTVNPKWPGALGKEYKSPWGFDDRYSIIRAILIAQGNNHPSSQEVKELINQIFEKNNTTQINDKKYSIIHATYGSDNEQENVTDDLKVLTGEKQFNFSGGHHSFNALFGDPDSGAKKQLSVTFINKNDIEHNKVIEEDEPFTLP